MTDNQEASAVVDHRLALEAALERVNALMQENIVLLAYTRQLEAQIAQSDEPEEA